MSDETESYVYNSSPIQSFAFDQLITFFSFFGLEQITFKWFKINNLLRNWPRLFQTPTLNARLRQIYKRTFLVHSAAYKSITSCVFFKGKVQPLGIILLHYSFNYNFHSPNLNCVSFYFFFQNSLTSLVDLFIKWSKFSFGVFFYLEL